MGIFGGVFFDEFLLKIFDNFFGDFLTIFKMIFLTIIMINFWSDLGSIPWSGINIETRDEICAQPKLLWEHARRIEIAKP